MSVPPPGHQDLTQSLGHTGGMTTRPSGRHLLADTSWLIPYMTFKQAASLVAYMIAPRALELAQLKSGVRVDTSAAGGGK
ncbi:hypothetical protein MCOR31_008924 [Pyricularia oryzae]|uniref:Uncharacterized protein n=1 Tax=Pyricularia grisea TaxID=148305 RepID=A0ABQ8NVL3_PYRGI|nr:hypothetical protein MCOR33_003114 [Pyricularia grisea]KAI6360896.1 hypothetical protein MCOR31_008924 [Pyricularia oryzae]KAI6419416.1 hypothetical protein MCOR21_010299 [Pyricularia oryzae]KAI6420037.1 hypothetical protein MCOR24_004827 [Pyricularia oryzae]KAI6453264.1 hypothetical protein MCOR15_008685 [Pyricularia oryzae]